MEWVCKCCRVVLTFSACLLVAVQVKVELEVWAVSWPVRLAVDVVKASRLSC